MTLLRDVGAWVVASVTVVAFGVLAYVVGSYIDFRDREKRRAKRHAAFRHAFLNQPHTAVAHPQYTTHGGQWYIVAPSPADAVDSLIELARDRGTLS